MKMGTFHEISHKFDYSSLYFYTFLPLLVGLGVNLHVGNTGLAVAWQFSSPFHPVPLICEPRDSKMFQGHWLPCLEES